MVKLPKRVRLKRTKGWKMPERTKICDRRNIYGNIYSVESYLSRGLVKWRVTKGYSYNQIVHYNSMPYYYRDGVIGLETRQEAIAVALDNFNEGISATLQESRREWLKPLLDYDFIGCWCAAENLCHCDILIRWLEIEFGQERDQNGSFTK